MNFKKNQTLNITISIYLLLIFAYSLFFYFFDDTKKVPLASNELGDFLAGLFAPLAFLYIYLGFKQQGMAIKESNDSIIRQLEIQTEMIRLQQAESLAREHAAKPILNFHPEIISGNELIFKNDDVVEIPNTLQSQLKITLGNKGSKITHVSMRCVKPFFKMLNHGDDVLDTNGVLVFQSFIDRSLFSDKSNALSDIDIEVIYTTSIGARYKSVYEINLPMGLDGNNILYSYIESPIRIN